MWNIYKLYLLWWSIKILILEIFIIVCVLFSIIFFVPNILCKIFIYIHFIHIPKTFWLYSTFTNVIISIITKRWTIINCWIISIYLYVQIDKQTHIITFLSNIYVRYSILYSANDWISKFIIDFYSQTTIKNNKQW